VRAYFAGHKQRLIRACNKWHKSYKAWREANPEKAALLDAAAKTPSAAHLLEKIPVFPADTKHGGSRASGRDVLQPLAAELPLLIGGSADPLRFDAELHRGRQGFRCDQPQRTQHPLRHPEHAMAAISNGVAYDGIFRPSCATFLVFADYSRPAMRLAALSKLPVIYIYTHDSIGVGEDGPTHQPVETVSGLRVIPNLDVIRPADPEETAGAFAAAMERTDGPTLLALTRQAVPMLNDCTPHERRAGVLKGGYILIQETAPLTRILIASGSEVQWAVAAAKQLGAGTRVVSMPSFLRFDAQPLAYREAILPAACRKRVAIEAGVTGLWAKYVGLDGKIVGIDRFGLSAPGNIAMKELGITTESVVIASNSL
jgi:transketolase